MRTRSDAVGNAWRFSNRAFLQQCIERSAYRIAIHVGVLGHLCDGRRVAMLGNVAADEGDCYCLHLVECTFLHLGFLRLACRGTQRHRSYACVTSTVRCHACVKYQAEKLPSASFADEPILSSNTDLNSCPIA